MGTDNGGRHYTLLRTHNLPKHRIHALTIEYLARIYPVQKAFWENHGLQCGYCTPGMIMAAVEMLKNNPNPNEEEIRHGLEGNFCRCTGYHNIVKSVKAASVAMKGGA